MSGFYCQSDWSKASDVPLHHETLQRLVSRYLLTKLSERTKETALSGIMPDIPPLEIGLLKREAACNSREVGIPTGIPKIRNVIRFYL